MPETDNKVKYFILGLVVAFIIFIIFYFTIFHEEQTTMRKDPKYKEMKIWANDFIKNKLYDPGYKFNKEDITKNDELRYIVRKQINDIYPNNNAPENMLNVLAFNFINIDTIRGFKDFYRYVGLNMYEETSMKNDPRYSKASIWALKFEEQKKNQQNYILTDYDVEMRDITTDIVMDQINKLYPSNKVTKPFLKFISHNFINLAMVIVFNDAYIENGLHKL